MTFDDTMTVEAYVVAVLCDGEPRPPVMRRLDYDRVDIDMSKWPDDRRDSFAGRLRGALSDRHTWDVWFADRGRGTLCVSEREEAG